MDDRRCPKSWLDTGDTPVGWWDAAEKIRKEQWTIFRGTPIFVERLRCANHLLKKNMVAEWAFGQEI
jgi:hypothetical protein